MNGANFVIDPLRPAISAVVKTCRGAGIRFMMVSRFSAIVSANSVRSRVIQSQLPPPSPEMLVS